MPEVAKNPVDLVKRILKGDQTAESELISRYQQPIRLILLKRTRDIHLAQDICQDTFVLTLKKLRNGELRNPDRLSAFIRGIAINLTIQHYRREKRYVTLGDEINQSVPTLVQRGEDYPETEVTRRLIEDVLGQLAVERDREILRRYYLLDEDKEVICHSMVLTPAHFDRVLYRARVRMRTLLDQHPELRKLLLGGIRDE